MEKIKLVVWDLDETFWKGTLSEGGIEPVEENLQIIKTLTDRGIINSIASKNNFEEAKKVLEELGVWEYFIFPSINWEPKGQQIKNIVEQCQLRTDNVLFIDDNHLNIKEVEYYNPKISTKYPEFLNQILDHESLKGKDDSSHTRLKQYKILEKKQSKRKEYISNFDFLRDSNIELEIELDVFAELDRIVELIQRTNQLNYTKKRISRDQVISIIRNPEYETAIIRVRDKYGDYGIIGFYCLDKVNDSLLHFLFSCRIINLGIPQYVFSKLNYPHLIIVPEVAERLDKTKPDWVKETDTTTRQRKRKKDDKSDLKILFKGGCDLSQMSFYLKEFNIDVDEETNYVSKDNFPIHNEHTQVLLDSQRFSIDKINKINNLKYLKFIDNNFYTNSVFDQNYDCLVYSVLMDYTQQLFYNEELQLSLPFGEYSNIWTYKKNHKNIIKGYKERGINNITIEDLEDFSNNFKHLGQISEEVFFNNLVSLRRLITKEIPIIFINGAEVSIGSIDTEGLALQRHVQMNATLDRFIESSENTYLLDVRRIVSDRSFLKGDIRHYERQAYKKMSDELIKIIEKFNTKESKVDYFHKTNRYLKEISYGLKDLVKNLIR